jgi:hypothetical protein
MREVKQSGLRLTVHPSKNGVEMAGMLNILM